jgi:hypothetical protein
MALSIFKNKWLIRKPVNRAVRIVELLIALSIAALSFKEGWKFPSGIYSVLSAVILFSLYWERDAGQQLFVHIDESGVRMPVTSRKRFIAWSEIDQVLLNYGVLTIDCIDNKLFQTDVAGNSVNLEMFDAFCKEQVAAHMDKRRNDNW